MNTLSAKQSERIAGVVLAGGRSRRMGEDKARLLLAGQTMVERTIAGLAPQVTALAISSNADANRYAALPILSDAEFAFEGPLAGILAGLRWALRDVSSASWLVTVPTDAPFVPRDLVTRLRAASSDPSVTRIAASDGTLHPVFGLWPVAPAPLLEAWLANGRPRRVRDWLDEIPHVVVDFGSAEPDPFFNINTPDDVKIALTRLSEFAP